MCQSRTLFLVQEGGIKRTVVGEVDGRDLLLGRSDGVFDRLDAFRHNGEASLVAHPVVLCPGDGGVGRVGRADAVACGAVAVAVCGGIDG